MRELAILYQALDSTTSINRKVDELAAYFEKSSDKDKVWTIALLSHRRPKRSVSYRLLGEWASEMANMPQWLFEECYHIVGDYAETIALLLPLEQEPPSPPSLAECMELLIKIRPLTIEEKRTEILTVWKKLNPIERFLFNKLITGGLRVGVSQKLMVRALAKSTNIEENVIAHRLMGDWDPALVGFDQLILEQREEDQLSKPYPFYLAYALEGEPDDLGAVDQWQIERKWDGIRGQIIVRKDNLFVWTRGEELVTDKYPEFAVLSEGLPNGTVIDGEIIGFDQSGPLPFQLLQKRIGRKTLSKKMLQQIPIVMIAYDILECEHQDIRQLPMSERREILEKLLASSQPDLPIVLSETVSCKSWPAYDQERQKARQLRNEGLMIKRKTASYGVGRKKGDWWKWKVDPFQIDAVMIYAQRGHGRRASMFTDFTFGVWSNGELVTFAKAYSGLTKLEFEEITRWVRANTVERFGPVAVVKPVHVFELHFEGIGASKRHKSGVAVRFPRIHRWRKDKRPDEANTLDDLKNLIV